MARKSKQTGAQGQSTPARPAVAKAVAKPDARTTIPVVGLGASAGALQAYSAFFDVIPADTGAAYVLVHHVDPDHKSLMADLLTKHTKMPVVLAEDQSPIQAERAASFGTHGPSRHAVADRPVSEITCQRPWQKRHRRHSIGNGQ